MRNHTECPDCKSENTVQVFELDDDAEDGCYRTTVRQCKDCKTVYQV